MTDKRFTYELQRIFDNGECFAYANSLDNAISICKVLNRLVDENEQLKEEIKDFQDLLANRESELLKPVWDKIYSEFENILYAEKPAIIHTLNDCYDEIMKR